MVTADGVFRRASETENPDLFWAVRGGGGNFGVVTNFHFKLHPLGPIVYFAAPVYAMEDAKEVNRKWRDFCKNAPDEISSFALHQTLPAADAFPEHVHDKQVVVMPTVYVGSVEDGEKALAPLRELGTPVLDLSGPIPFRVLQGLFDWIFPVGNRYYWKTVSAPELTDEAIDTVVDIASNRSSPGTVVGIWQMGGAISRVADDATGYGPRSAAWTLQVDSGWADPTEDARHIAFTRDAIERLSAYSDGSMYIHYNVLEDTDGLKAAYGSVYDRLAQVKAKYDPMNLFRVNQNIKPDVDAMA